VAVGTKNFKISEFSCKCRCGFDDIDQDIVDACQEIRDYLGKPLIINSGCRCPKHNKKVGSSSTNHTRGKAADLGGVGADALVSLIKAIDKPGTAVSKLDFVLHEGTWVHIDKAGRRKNGKYQSV
jgi:uncharacterized protein YcbK (DUF882 family)